ncbi:MAG TPA: M28 family metallopeptidase [Phenylobacterium sp.]|jgi:Zn-dependent M28 family amino/carboxypeptidase|uniref:M28 family metallopeptidase n=1 Tax=Phenylobacterium sp. TaxID=1871053 RepID=UPI002D38DC4F|nr:M28 family metallopeptidase [Phenylobacterium sp.]HZZ68198.1 M28 family metallopeptidase [Phenylobacterium sp.]
MRTLSLISAAALAALAAPAIAADTAAGSGPISPERLSADVKVLADAKLYGRAPGGPGEAGTLAWLEGQFKALGLKPAGDNGGWTQAVPLIRFTVAPDPKFSLTAGGKTQPLVETKQIMAWTQRPVARVSIDKAPLVFVGYGVTAPERGWDDFKGVDLKGKIAVFLINDPDFEAQPGEPVYGKFGGKAATYYGRWIYKYEEAARRGALGALIVHETAGAAYPWSTVTASNGDSYDVVRPDAAKVHPLLQGWIQRDVAVDLFKASGLDFEALKKQARSASFHPVTLKDASFSADLGVKTVRLLSHNVLAEIPGTKRPNESVMFGAHWDAFGQGPADATGDTIRHGAIDDGMGVAGVLEIARAFAKAPPPQRTVVFGIWTAEERGLLGSEYYASHPKFPLATTAGDFTMDVVQTAGPSHDLVLVGAGQDSLEGDLAKAAAGQGRTITPDPYPEKALFYRADHFSVAKRGVPTLLIMGMAGGPDLLKGGRAAGERWVSDYTTRCYHQVCDNWSPDWDLRGAAQDIDLFYEVGRDLANSSRWPTWNATSEFKPIRAQTAAARK